MEYFVPIIFFVLGFIIGQILIKISVGKERVTGVVQIDHSSGLCRFRVEDETLSDLKCKKVVFRVDHNAIINEDTVFNNSQEKQVL